MSASTAPSRPAAEDVGRMLDDLRAKEASRSERFQSSSARHMVNQRATTTGRVRELSSLDALTQNVAQSKVSRTTERAKAAAARQETSAAALEWYESTKALLKTEREQWRAAQAALQKEAKAREADCVALRREVQELKRTCTGHEEQLRRVRRRPACPRAAARVVSAPSRSCSCPALATQLALATSVSACACARCSKGRRWLRSAIVSSRWTWRSSYGRGCAGLLCPFV
jgi:hypothetical protein